MSKTNESGLYGVVSPKRGEPAVVYFIYQILWSFKLLVCPEMNVQMTT